MSFSDERDLLKRWTSLVLETDPDVIIGGWGLIRGACLHTPNKRTCTHARTCLIQTSDAAKYNVLMTAPHPPPPLRLQHHQL